MNNIIELLNQYGYLVLFFSLVLELIAFPLPGEVLMGYCGYLVYKGEMNWVLSILVASSGVIVGITISHFLGSTLGVKFFNKYGHYVHLTPERLSKLSSWFDLFGARLLIVAYFIPGVRHLTGYFSGITGIGYKRFAINAYLGALIWTGAFISLGKSLGSNWETLHVYVRKYILIGGIALLIILIILYIYRSKQELINQSIHTIIEKTFVTYHSFGKVKATVAFIAALCLGLFIITIGLTEDLLTNEFRQFDDIVTTISQLVFTPDWLYTMGIIKKMVSPAVIILLAVFTLIWIMLKSRFKYLDSVFLGFVYIGGYILENLLRLLFHRLGPLGDKIMSNIKYTFPGENTFMAIVAYGFTMFLIVRYIKNKSIKTLALTSVLILCFLVGISELFFESMYPSDIVAGYAFGGFWLCLSIILLEIYHMLPTVKNKHQK